MGVYVNTLRKLISRRFYNKAFPKSNLKSGSVPVCVVYPKALTFYGGFPLENTVMRVRAVKGTL